MNRERKPAGQDAGYTGLVYDVDQRHGDTLASRHMLTAAYTC
jgi:hypothetical protein